MYFTEYYGRLHFLEFPRFEETESKTESQLKNTRAQGVVVVCRFSKTQSISILAIEATDSSKQYQCICLVFSKVNSSLFFSFHALMSRHISTF